MHCGVAAEWWADYTWSDLKCKTACDGELTQRGLLKEDNNPYPESTYDNSRCDHDDPEFEDIVLKWRVRDAFGFVTWDKYPEDVRAAFEAFMLAGEVAKAYAYAHDRSLLRY
jgi:hypothetical protein